jgi:hypothetical protein
MDPHRLVEAAIDRRVEQQAIGAVHEGIVVALLGAEIGTELVDVAGLERWHPIPAWAKHVGEFGVNHQALRRFRSVDHDVGAHRGGKEPDSHA